jgi:hypothetical protein
MAQIENPGALAGATGAGMPCYAVEAGFPKLAPEGFCSKFERREACTFRHALAGSFTGRWGQS